jgi:hypothetical protein
MSTTTAVKNDVANIALARRRKKANRVGWSQHASTCSN